MGDGRLRRAATVVALLLLLGLLASCAGGLSITPVPGSQTGPYPVDTVFKEFYQALGGREVLGPAISPLEIRENLQCQFTERVQMCFNQAAVDDTRYTLYPLGRSLEIEVDSFPAGAAAGQGARIVDGFAVYEKFLPLYDRLFGARYVGRPLTELRVNQDLERAEQFFENVGFYQKIDEPNGPVYLIPYGAYLCGRCSSRLDEYWSIVKANRTEQYFGVQVARLGGPAVFGSLLLKPQMTQDGYIQQVYANAIFYSKPDEPHHVRLRPLPLVLRYESQPLAQKIEHPNLVFFEINDGLGYNIPMPFDHFISAHGGYDMSGTPIAEVIRLPEGIFRQCFENYCLIYDPAAVDVLKVRMAPLGKEFLERYPPPEEIQIRNIFTPDRIGLAVSTDKPNLNQNEEQFIRLFVYQKDSGQGIERVEADLVLQTPGQTAQRLVFPPTDAAGTTMVGIPPNPELLNGSRLTYEVCLNLPSDQPICDRQSYFIWDLQP